MRAYMLVLLAVAMLAAAPTVYAETCDAGHGCRITCKDGCVAIYNEDNGKCTKACGSAARVLAREAVELKAKHNVAVSIKGLKGYTAQKAANQTPATTAIGTSKPANSAKGNAK